MLYELNDWRTEYRLTQALALKYETAEKHGFDKSGKRKRENQMILVPRGEAVDLAKGYALRAHICGIYLAEVFGWMAYANDAVELAPERLTCKQCRRNYLPLPENAECPFCRIERDARETVNSLLSALMDKHPDE